MYVTVGILSKGSLMQLKIDKIRVEPNGKIYIVYSGLEIEFNDIEHLRQFCISHITHDCLFSLAMLYNLEQDSELKNPRLLEKKTAELDFRIPIWGKTT